MNARTGRRRQCAPAHDRQDTHPDTTLMDELLPRRLRRQRDRLHEAWLQSQGQPCLSAEAQDFVEFAVKWAPFGGASEEETFVQFGMTRMRFSERLWELVDGGQIGDEISRSIAADYPRPSCIHRSRIGDGPRPSLRSGAPERIRVTVPK